MSDSSSSTKPGALDGTGTHSIGSPVFAGILVTQFLGAFNDNYFKQLVLLKCVSLAAATQTDLQGLAQAAFALPFVLLSGLGGYLSDRLSKRSVIVACKMAEIAIMGMALWILWPGEAGKSQLMMLITVLAFMGAQSAIFGPSKYGILPEIFDRRSLLPVNGSIQTTTFLAIIFGVALAGIAMDHLSEQLWKCSLVAVGIAAVGTLTSFLICPTPVAEPDLKLQKGNLFVPPDVRTAFRAKPAIMKAIMAMTVFWFIGGVAQPAVNSLGENILELNRSRTSYLAAAIGVGIAVGCAIAGFMNRGKNSGGARWTTLGSWLIFTSLVAITLLGSGWFGKPVPTIDVKAEPLLQSLLQANHVEWAIRAAMCGLGISAGIFVIPIQVYIQQAPPPELKGRMIGAMNFMTWTGIVASAAFFAFVNFALSFIAGENGRQLQYLMFAALALFILPVAIFYRVPEE